MPTEGAPAESFLPSRCLPGHGVLGIPEGGAVSALTVGAGGALAWAQVDLPGSGESANHVRLENEGGVLIAWESRGEGVVPWRLRDDGGWTVAGAPFQSLDPPRGALLVGSDLLQQRGTAPHRGHLALAVVPPALGLEDWLLIAQHRPVVAYGPAFDDDRDPPPRRTAATNRRLHWRSAAAQSPRLH